jgi:hypothetical protein
MTRRVQKREIVAAEENQGGEGGEAGLMTSMSNDNIGYHRNVMKGESKKPLKRQLALVTRGKVVYLYA